MTINSRPAIPPVQTRRVEVLILTRKKSQSIKIGDNITIVVVQTGHGRVKLGIEAPADIRVLRSELTKFPECGVPSTVLEWPQAEVA